MEPVGYTLFVPNFFVSIGLSGSFDGLSEQLLVVLISSVLAITSKLIGSGLGAQLTGIDDLYDKDFTR